MYRSMTTVKADLARSEFGLTGEGIVWAVVSTGVDGAHPHFATFRNTELPAPLRHLDYTTFHVDRQAAREEHFDRGPRAPSVELVGLDEPDEDELLLHDRYARAVSGDVKGIGTAVAGIIAGRSTDPFGRILQGFTDRAKVLSIKVLDDEGRGHEFDLLAALRVVQLLNRSAARMLVHGLVLPLSFGWDVRNYACGQSPICAEVDRLVNSGVVVVTSVGNRSFDSERDRVVEGGITDPGNAELAVTVGSTHRSVPEVYGASFFSSRGPTADGRNKPDLLAPGERVTVCAPVPRPTTPAPGAKGRRRPRGGAEPPTAEPLPVEAACLDGTEIAAAHVAGAAAALLSAQPALVGKPQEVKELLLGTAVDLHRDRLYQGRGLLDALAAVRAAAGGHGKSPSRGPLKVFISYSHKDQALWKEFKAHLSPMERTGRIEVWSDQKLEAGQRWEKEIYARLNAADVILLLVSAHFFESDFCYSKEMQRALERDADGSARIIPVLVRPVSVKGTMLAEIQAVPQGAKPITSFGDPHEAWSQVADHLFDIVEKLAEGKNARPT